MKMRHIFRGVAAVAAMALLVLAVGCAAPADQTPADQNPADKPNADQNHSVETPAAKGHDHKEPALMGLAYEEAKDGTFALVVKDCKGKVVLNEKGLTKKAISKQIAPGVVQLAWVTSNKPGGYECLYINRLSCQVSDMIAGEQTTDGNRIVYSVIKDGKLNVIVRDLFDKNGYAKVTVIDEAYTAGEYTVLGSVMYGKDQVNVSYLTNKDGGHRIKSFELYEKGEEKPTQTTQTTKKADKK